MFQLRRYLLIIIAFVFPAISALADNDPSTAAPNILLIVIDDLGYTDLGSYGGEIETPNLDTLAYDGLRLTNFYTAPTCSPTRAMLLTGVDSHLAGLGNMYEELAPNQKGRPGYEGYLNTRAASLAEVVKNAGYNTYMTGKWHLGMEEKQSPAERGFDRSFVLLQGGGGHFDDLGMFNGSSRYREDGKLTDLPEDFYSTRFYTTKMLEYLKSGEGEKKPFFAYLSYTAVHWPLQAPEGSISKYENRYSQGYDELHRQRIEGAIDQGVLPVDSGPVPRLVGEPEWTSLDTQQRKVEERKMEIYAAMLDDVDAHVGKLIEYLKATGQYDNTIILIMSDNGAEGHDLEQGLTDLVPWVQQCCNNSYHNLGKADSYVLVGPNWARASVGSAKHYKGFTSEGGIKAPAFITYPQLKLNQPLSFRFTTVKDVMPTLLDLAGIEAPQGSFNGRDTLPMTGRSLFSNSEQPTPVIDMGWELMGKRGYRYGDWKAVHLPEPYGNSQWQLYNLAVDPGEQQDLATKLPKKIAELVNRWEQYALKNNVILPDWVSGY